MLLLTESERRLAATTEVVSYNAPPLYGDKHTTHPRTTESADFNEQWIMKVFTEQVALPYLKSHSSNRPEKFYVHFIGPTYSGIHDILSAKLLLGGVNVTFIDNLEALDNKQLDIVVDCRFWNTSLGRGKAFFEENLVTFPDQASITKLRPNGRYAVVFQWFSESFLKHLTLFLIREAGKDESLRTVVPDCQVNICNPTEPIAKLLDFQSAPIIQPVMFLTLCTVPQGLGTIDKRPSICSIKTHGLPNIGEVPDRVLLALLPRSLQKICDASRMALLDRHLRQPKQQLQFYLFPKAAVAKKCTASEMRYSITVYNATTSPHTDVLSGSGESGKAAAILVPVGQESDWLFATPEGNAQLAEQCGNVDRLLLIHLGASFTSIGPQLQEAKAAAAFFETIKAEVAPFLESLAFPINGSDTTIKSIARNVPVMTVASDPGTRIEIAAVPSLHSEIIFVYDFTDEAKSLKTKDFEWKRRQMVFGSNTRVVQSEISVLWKKGKPFAVDCLDMCSKYYGAIWASLGFLPEDFFSSNREPRTLSMLLLGVGGGGLTGILRQTILGSSAFASLHLTAVELDPSVLNVARQYFYYPPNGIWKAKEANSKGATFSLQTHVADASIHIEEVPSGSQHIIILDATCSQPDSAVMCPSEVFLTLQFLENAYRVLTENGLFIFNLVSRSAVFQEGAWKRIRQVFRPPFYRFTMDQDVNQVIVCMKQSHDSVSCAGCSPKSTISALPVSPRLSVPSISEIRSRLEARLRRLIPSREQGIWYIDDVTRSTPPVHGENAAWLSSCPPSQRVLDIDFYLNQLSIVP